MSKKPLLTRKDKVKQPQTAAERRQVIRKIMKRYEKTLKRLADR